MITELIAVGTELLLGNIVNTNSAYLAQRCASLGLEVYYQSVVGDNPERLKGAIRTALNRSDLVILTGGLGPTEDDITKEMAAEVLGLPLIEDPETRNLIEEYMKQYAGNHARRRITQNNFKQAMIPEGAIILTNRNGTAPGLVMEKDDKALVLLPGPPSEMKPMFEEAVFPYLRRILPDTIFSRVIKISGIGESQVADEIADLIEKQTNPTIAPYAKTGEVHLRVTAKGSSEKECQKMIKPVVRELRSRFGKNIFATDEDKTLEGVVVDMLRDQGLTLALAEDITGGVIASRIGSIEGAAEVLSHSIVCCSGKSKRKLLGVKKYILKTEGIVSPKCVKEMAKGATSYAKADMSLAVTGYAGPEGSTEEAPAGTVYMACNYNKHTEVREYHFTGNSARIREQAAANALEFLRECIMEGVEKN